MTSLKIGAPVPVVWSALGRATASGAVAGELLVLNAGDLTFERLQQIVSQPDTARAAQRGAKFHISCIRHRLGAKPVVLIFFIVEHRLAHLAEHLGHQHRLELLREALDLLTIGVGSLRGIERNPLRLASLLTVSMLMSRHGGPFLRSARLQPLISTG